VDFFMACFALPAGRFRAAVVTEDAKSIVRSLVTKDSTLDVPIPALLLQQAQVQAQALAGTEALTKSRQDVLRTMDADKTPDPDLASLDELRTFVEMIHNGWLGRLGTV
jgi:hypothetical protein